MTRARGGATRAVTRQRWDGASGSSAVDTVAVEEPLEIRVAQTPVAVLLRTPGHDEDLATGFALTERLVAGVEDIESVVPCEAAPAAARGNVVDVQVTGGAKVDLRRFARPRFSNSACGVCGAAALENLLMDAGGVLDDAARFKVAAIHQATGQLLAAQPAFAMTGGLHAAGIMDQAGALGFVREDVGRHNATDKALGAYALAGFSPSGAAALVVSSRAGFEIVQKALVMRMAMVVTVGAPTSLAVEVAQRGGVTLVAFARSGSFSVYAHAARVEG